MKTSKIPQFIIIEAMKCGTSSFYKYLTAHPQILPPTGKELHFFDFKFKKGLDWYLKQFPSRAEGENFITGEASPYYIFHPAVPQRLFDLCPQTKLIVLLRNPVDRAISHYYHSCRKKRENLSFAEAIARESERLNSRTEDEETYYRVTYRRYSYLSRGIYVEQLQRWMNIFPREQFSIVKSEDLFTDPPNVLKNIFEFLGVSDYRLREYFHYNHGKYESIDDSIRARLCEYFQPHNQRLEQYLGIKFNWESESQTQNRKAKIVLESPDRLQEITQKLERSRQLLTSIQARLKPLSQLSAEAQTTNHQIVPNLAFITCIEAGYLEAQSLLLYESIRRYGGRFSQCPIYAVSPRAGRAPSPQTKQRLEQLSVEYIDLVLNSELDFFSMANKGLACAYIEENKSHEILVWLDSDTLLFREPSKFWLPDYTDVAVRPINRKRNTTSGANDPFDDYWQKMCKACDVDYDSIPFLETFVDRCIIKACYNGGLVVVRPEKGIFRRWSENLRRGVRLGFDPRIDRCWVDDQPALSLAMWGATERVQILDPVYNYNIQAIDAEPQQAKFYSSLPLCHIHYHQMFSAKRLSKNPLLQPNFIWEDQLKQWLMQYIPLSV